jgi:hypothetical protein
MSNLLLPMEKNPLSGSLTTVAKDKLVEIKTQKLGFPPVRRF